jgi:16S rRNA (guanine527-N7)-methyltransferase
LSLDAQPDVITARALAPLPALLDYVAPFLKTGAQALLLKGQDVEVELTEAAKYWNIQAELAPSQTNPAGRIVIVRGLQRRSVRS